MDPVALVIIFKGLGMLTVIAGGIAVSRYGFHLYKEGTGIEKDQAAFELGKVKIKASSAGSIIMSTAFLWAFAGVLLSPNFEKKGEEIKIYSMESHVGEVEAVALSTNRKGVLQGLTGPTDLEVLFKAAIQSTSKKTNIPIIKVNGEAASIDTNLTTSKTSKDGRKILSTRITTHKKEEATINYEAVVYNKKVTFTPTDSH